MSGATTALLALAGTTAVLKGAGPLLLGGRRLPRLVSELAIILPVPLLAAMVATSTLVEEQGWTVDERLPGLVVAGICLWRRLPFLVVVLAAAATTALLRQIA